MILFHEYFTINISFVILIFNFNIMSEYIVSARKYRPVTFDSVVGQSAVTSTLKNAINSNQLAQSFLFCGPRGVGKTTCARIFAKEINKFNNNNQIEDFSFNIFELDAASNNSVDDIRNLTDQVRVPPQIGKFKVYIIDEVHMLSQAAFNAFLKTLEEPPKHAKFILATTEKHKIIPTILSRCQIFDFKRVSVNDIVSHLDFVAKSESIEAEKEALYLIAQKADGAMRDSLSIFDRIISFSDKKLTYKSVIELLNILDYDYYFKITDCLLSNDIRKLLNIYDEILKNGFDGHHFINGLAEHLRDILVSKDEETVTLLSKGIELKDRYLEQSRRCELNFLLTALNMCNDCDFKYKTTNNQRLLVELTLMRIASIGHMSEKKNFKSFVVTQDDAKASPLNEKIDENNNKKEQNLVLESVKDIHNIEPHLPIKKKSTLISINGLSNEVNEDKKEADSLILRDYDFSEIELIEYWKEFVSFVKEKGKSNLAIALQVYKPKLLENYLIELSISNAVQEEIILDEKYMILDYLKNKLKNDKIEITTKILKIEMESTPYTRKDKFKIMLEENPQLEVLRLKLGLDTDY